ncbi:MAG: hypothetical protein KUF79_17230 [Candidatus Thiodiazotropha sp. (ex Ctena orbiculata)]|nr:hypothetical protein [Candidatus Thiodiazotropha taylori]
MSGSGGAGLMVVVYVFLFFLALLWFFLPFAVFGVKGYLKKLDDKAKIATDTLARIEQQLKDREGGVTESVPALEGSKESA